MNLTLRLGTRGSLLARSQSRMVADALQHRHPGLRVELEIIQTSGDRLPDQPLRDAGGKGLFTKELEQALIDGRVDFAVHSFKDVPVTQPLVDVSSLTIAAVPKREDPRDVLVSAKRHGLEELPPQARVGTSSLRRKCQLLARRDDLRIEPVRGNIDTRLRKLREGQFEAIVLAAAGLRRTGLYDDSTMIMLEPQRLLPAAGQGALAIQCRADDRTTLLWLTAMHDEPTGRCVMAEREVVRLLNGDCHSPIAALGVVEEGRLHLRAAVGGPEGFPPVLHAEGRGPADDPEAMAQEVCRRLMRAGAGDLLA